jgi:SAM-dependent methyltransferase
MSRARRIPQRPEPRLGRAMPPEPARPRDPASEGALTRLARRVLGLRRVIECDGVAYRETGPVSLERAIASKRHRGKRYAVTFPDGRRLSITATGERRFADLMDDPPLRSLRAAPDLIRPGSRVLILGGGTGALGALVANWTGPHGGVVSVEFDAESVRFARRRYPGPGISFERGGPEVLGGEMDGAFDTTIAIEPWLDRTGRRAAALAEAWRVTGRGGRLVLIGPPTDDPGFDHGRASTSARPGMEGAPALLIVERAAGGAGPGAT